MVFMYAYIPYALYDDVYLECTCVCHALEYVVSCPVATYVAYIYMVQYIPYRGGGGGEYTLYLVPCRAHKICDAVVFVVTYAGCRKMDHVLSV